MPSEWQKHEATWLSWPRQSRNWTGARLGRLRQTFLRIIQTILPGEKVHLLVKDSREKKAIQKLLLKSKVAPTRVFYHFRQAKDIWIRDYGPIFLKRDNQKLWLKWQFNAWGRKYHELVKDNHVFQKSAFQLIPHPCRPVPMVLEGGSIDVNGRGLCLTTEQCLLNPNRNPFLSKKQIERQLKLHLGIREVLWLAGGIEGDDTDGHVDDIARFTGERTIAAAFEENPDDPNYPVLSENWKRLEQFKARSKKMRLVKIPMPGKVKAGTRRLPASYLNFYIANHAILLPVFGVKSDPKAIAIFQNLFPHRRICPIRSNDLVYGCGAIHCMTQQEPA